MKKIYFAKLKNCKIYIILFCAFFSLLPNTNLFGQTVVPFTAAGATTWFCPAGVTSITVECWGGGGAGGGATANPSAGGGGAGGAYAKAINVAVSPGTTYNLFVGAGGIGSTTAGPSGGSSWFNSNTTLLAVGGTGGALATNGAGATAPTTGNIGGTTNFYAGNGGTGTGTAGSRGGGGGGSAGTAGNGNSGVGVTGGVAVTGGGAGANGSTNSADGTDATTLGGGGAGAHAGSGTDRNGGNGFTGKVTISYTTPGTYVAQLVSMNTGSANWCAGETRTVSVTLKNIGTATWTDAPRQDMNVGVKWNSQASCPAAGSNWCDYYIRTDVGNITPGNSGTYTFAITASNNIGAGYTTALAAGSNNLTFNVVYEAVMWFPTPFTSAAQTIVAIPNTPTGTAAQSFCTISNPTVANLAATVIAGNTVNWYSASTGGSPIATTTPLASGTYYASQSTPSGCESVGRFAATATVNNPAAPTGAASQPFCTINNPTVANISVTGTTTKWYTVSTGGTAIVTTTPLVNGTTYYASQTLSGCESATRLAVTVTVGNPAAPTGSGTQSFCAVTTPTVGDIVITGTAPKWYTVSTGGTAIVTTTPLVNGTTYYASQTLSGCESATRLAVTVTVGNPAAPTGSGTQSFCAITTPTVGDIVITATAPKWYTVSTGGTAIVTTTPLVNGTTYYASQTLSGCESATRLAVTVTVGNPAAPTGFGTQSFCAITTPTVGDIVITATSPKWYTVSTGGTTIVTTTPLVNGTTYYASQTVSGCESATRLAVTVTVGNPLAPTGAASQPFCTIDNPKISDIAVTGTAVQWYSVSTGGIAIATTTSLVNGTTYYASQTVSGCESATRLAVTVTVGNPSAPTGTASQSFCADANPTVADLSATGNLIQWYTAATGGTALSSSTALVNNTHYYASQTVSGCESALRLDVTATIYQPVIITANPLPLTQKVCATTTVNFSVTATGSGLTYQWLLNGSSLSNTTRITGVTTANLQITGVTSGEAGTYSVVVSGLSPCASATSDTAHLDVDQRAVFITQPATPLTICEGSPYTISARATGTIATYKWNKIGLGYYADAVFDGVDKYSLTIPVVVPGDAGNYQLILDDGTTGCSASNSNIAVLIVNPTPTATISGTTTVCQSSTPAPLVTFTNPNALPVTITYNINLGTNLTVNVNANTSATVAAPTGTAGTFDYNLVSVAYQGAVACSNPLTGTATITVSPTPDVVATPASQSICSGDAITPIALSGSVVPTTFNWTRNNASVTGIATSGSGDISGSLTNATNAPITVTFTITPTAAGCVGTAITATVVVNPTSSVNTVTNQTVCNNAATAAINFSSPTTGGTIVYNWTNNTPSIGLPASGAGNIASFTATNAGTAPVTATITVTPSYTNGATCPGTPSTFTITVNPVATVNTVSNQTVCKNTATTAVNFGSPTTGGTIVYNWTNNAPSIGLAASGAGNIASFTATNVTTAPVIATITVTPSYTNGATCPGTPITFTITVNPAATVNTVTNQTLCNSALTTAVNFTSPTTGGTIVYNWTNNAPSIGLPASGAGNIASFTATNAGTAPVIATITVTPSYTNGATCPGTPSTFTITVNPVATVNTVSNQTVCNNAATTAVTFGSPTTGGAIVYNWTNNTTSIGLAASGTGNIASFTATNVTAAPVVATITVTPSYTNGATCAGTPITFTITVNPAATVNAISNQTLCNNAATTAVTFSSPTAGGTIVYNWTNNAPSIGLPASGAGNIASFTATNVTTAPVIATITVTPSYTNGATCPGTPITFTITVNPAATVTTVSNKTFCNNTASGAINFSSPTTGGTIIYNWTNNTPSIGLPASGAGNIASFTATNAGTAPVIATITVTPSYTNGATCPGTPSTFTITVNPVATVNTVSNQTVCKNTATTAVNFGSPTTGGTIVYNWTNNAPSVGLPASGAGNIPSFTATNITTAPVTATITVTPSYTNGATCGGTPITFTITVNPAATVTAVSNQTVCNNAITAAVTFSSPTSGGTIVYNWTNNAPSIGLAASGAGDIASFTATNVGTAPVIATITVTPSYTNGATCPGTPSTFTITVNPTPNSIATPSSQTKCSGIAITTIVLSTSATPAASTAYTWTRNNTATVTGIAASGTGNIAGILTNITAAPITVTFTIIPTYSGGCVGTSTTATVLVNPKPTAGNITGASTVCIGSNITLTPAGSGIGTLTYAWSSSAPSVATVNAVTGLVTGVGAGTTQITYTVTDANGCSSATSPAFAVTVTKPTANAITTTANPANSVCLNSTIQLISNATGTGTLTYTWASSDNTKATVSTTGIVSGIAAGTVNITYTVTDINGCSTTSAAYSITILAIPAGTLSETDNSGTANNDKIICAGASATFTFSVSGLGSYIFKVNGVQKQSGTSNVFSSLTLANGDNVTVDVANASNCGATFGPILMTVKLLPTPTLTVTPGTTICPNDPVTLTTPANAGSTYSFIINGTTVSTGASNTYTTIGIATTSTVAVMETNSNGCQATTANQTVTVSPVPSGTLTVSPGASFCPGTSVTFTATAGAGNTYNFKVGSTSVQNTTSNTYTTTTLVNGDIITVVVTNASGCSTTLNPISVTVNPPPAGLLNAFENSGVQNDNNICANAPVTFTFSNTTYSGYNFKVNGVSKQNNGTASYINSTLLNGDVVTVVVTSGSGCVGTFTAPTITIAPSPSVTLSALPATACAGDNVTFTATPLDPTYNYNFQVNGTTVQNGSANTYSSTSIVSTDVITVDVTNSNACTTTSNAVSVSVTPLPTVVANNQTVCAPATVDLTAAAVTAGSTPGLSFSYFTDAGGTLVYSTPATAGAGTYYIKGTTTGGCSSISPVTVTVNPLPVIAAITGNTNVCLSNTTALSDATTGGIWSSLNTSIATVNNASGLVTGVAAGSATINYTVTIAATGCSNAASTTVTVNAPPTVAPITGNFNVCTGNTSQLNDATAGGTWTSGSTGVATVDASGLVTGVAPGNEIISYSFTDVNGCTTVVTATVTVANSPTVAAITPATPGVCVGGNITFSDATTGGVWSSGTTTVATITSSGMVTGIAGGTSLITYTITTSCGGTASASTTVTVNAPPSATIAYTGSPFCTSSAPISVVQTGTTGGTYSASPAGLSLAVDGTITPSTSAAGTYTVTYTVAASGGCAIYTTTAIVTITAAASATISYAGTPFCTSSAPVLVTRTGTGGGTYSSTGGLTINSSTGTITPSTSTAGLYLVTYTVAATGGCTLFSTTASVTITTAPSATISYTAGSFCTSSLPVNVTRTGTAGGTYSSTAGLTINSATGSITAGTGGTYIISYTLAASGGCGIYTATTSVTINPLPTATISGTIGVCKNSAPQPNVTFTGAGGTAPYTFTYKINAGGNLTVTSVGNTTTVAAPTSVVGTFTYTLISVKDASSTACSSNQSGTAVITVNDIPTISVIPVNTTLCQSSIQSLTATSTGTPVTQNLTVNGSTNVAIPDATTFFGTIPGSVTTSVNVSGIPAGAVISNVSVKLNVLHNNDGDLNFNIQAPNNNILNLVNRRGGSGHNFTNTIITAVGGVALSTGVVPYTGTYSPDASTGIGPVFGPNSNVSLFSSLTGTPNGNWTLYGLDANDNGIGGTISSWSLSIDYQVPTSNPVTWSPATDLYTDASATTPYTGQSLTTVYSRPSSPGTIVYTATATNASNCTNTAQATLTVSAPPVVTIGANYCLVPGQVVLTATHTAGTVLWSNGKITDTIHVDESGDYSVTVTNAQGCKASATISVSKELVTNGDFEQGDGIGFTTLYGSQTGNHYAGNQANAGPGSGLWQEGYYAVDASAFSPSNGVGYHPNFHGRDHTTGSGKFMMINGSTALRTIWQETVTVLPNTIYYFSAWGMNLNPTSPAQLQFAVNGTGVGSIGDLSAAPTPMSEGQVNLANWLRFYGTWTSGPTTTSAVITIVNLNTAPGGNDFGLDDISFATLSTFLNLESAPGTDAQTICFNTPLTNIIYSFGNGNSNPAVTGLPAGVAVTYAGDRLTISGTPTVAGNSTYTITTTGCSPFSVTGTITAQGQAITLSSGSSSPTVCTNSPVNIGYTLSGTATGATQTGLTTAGLTLTVTGTSVTVTGTPTVAGSYPYTITTTGTCPGTAVTINGTITVSSQTITINSGNNVQTVCINAPIANIQYTVGAPGNNASVIFSPAGSGLIGNYGGGLFVISGSPTLAGTITYTVTTAGTSCTPATATGTITVTPAASLTLTSAPSTNPQTVCKGFAINNITYSVNNGTGASVTGLPAGVSGASSGGIFTISGTPTSAPGIFNYTITTSGGCGTGTATGTITVQTQTITLTSGSTSPTTCINVPMTPNIVYTIGGTATGASVTGLPAGMSGSLTGSTFTISGTPTASGPFLYTVTLTGSCATTVTTTGTITVTPSAIGGTLTSSLSICSGTTGTLNLSGNSSNPVRWEYSTDGGATWTTVANTTISLTTPALTAARLYRAVVNNTCGTVFSTMALVGIHNLWVGGISSDWNTAANWSDGQIPTPTPCLTVTIPVVTGPNVYPVLSSGSIGTITNLVINAGASLTITGNTLQIAGLITNNGTFDVSGGAIEFNGGAGQTVPANAFTGNTIKDLIISNDIGLSGPESLTGTLSFGSSGKAFATNDNLTLKSSILGTASVDKILGGNSISGNVTVERYIATGPSPSHAKSWQLLAIPTTGQTIKAAWQEGATATNIPPPAVTISGNPKPGYGTMITSDVANAATQPTPGFDGLTAPGPSMKVYNSATDNYIGPTSTALPIYDQKGYFILVRGDRSVYLYNQAATPTILRTKGILFTPASLPPTTTVLAGKLESVGNPYASEIDLTSLLTPLPSGINSTVIVWDPTLGGGYGLGGFQTLYLNGGNYINLLTSTAYGPSGTINNNIQSGQAFIIQALPASGGTLTFTENAKTTGSKLLFRPQAPVGDKNAQLRTNLYAITASGTFLTDGTLIQYNTAFSDSIDGLDARKMINTGENLAIKTSGKLLVVERRQPIIQRDTIFFNLTGVRVQQYQFQFSADNINATGLEGFLEDNYLHTKTPVSLSGSTVVNFTIENIAGSYAPDRFRIVFKPSVALPVTFTSVKAYQQDKNINVEWRVENENNMKQYEVEKSINGTTFTTLAVKAATANGGRSAIYVTTDITPVVGYNYYRVKSVDINGKTAYTNIVKVLMGSSKQDIVIVPNPITDGMIHLQLLNQPEGRYGLRLLDKLGQVIVSRQINRAAGSTTELIKWDFNLAHGMYQLEVTKPDGGIKNISVLY